MLGRRVSLAPPTDLDPGARPLRAGGRVVDVPRGGAGLAKPPTAVGSRASSKKEAEAWLSELRSQKDEL